MPGMFLSSFRPVEEAFKSGVLVMPTEPTGALPPTGWDGYMVNSILVVVALISFVLSLDSLIHVGRSLIMCSISGRENFRIEDSVPQVRSRNLCFLSAILPFCIIISRYSIADNGFVLSHPAQLKTLVILAMFFSYVIVRFLLYKLLHPVRGNIEGYEIAHKSAMNSFVIATIVLFICIAVLTLSGVDISSSKRILTWVLAAEYFLYIIVKVQIFSSSYGVLTTFLYLCALEFIPTVALVGAIMLL